MPEQPSLIGENLTRSFGDGEGQTTPLKGVSLALAPGQFSLLMGPSGSGKSTLLAVLSGLLPPDTGEVIANTPAGGESVWSLSAKRRERFRLANVGFVFQGYNLFPALSARQQLEIVLRWGEGTGGGDARRRADEMLDVLGLGRLAHKKPHQLSGGEKQRVAIGRALVKNPRFCFADEPTSALDWSHGEKVVKLLQDAARARGATILAVSHDARILPYVDASFYLEDGLLRGQAAPAGTDLTGRNDT